MGAFIRALIATAIPIVALSVTSVVVTPVGEFSNYLFLWALAAALWVAAIGAAIYFYFVGKRSVAAGILAGIAIGALSLGLTCFANISEFL